MLVFEMTFPVRSPWWCGAAEPYVYKCEDLDCSVFVVLRQGQAQGDVIHLQE